MTVTYVTATRNAQATAMRDSIDNGAVGSGGNLLFESAADAEIATIQFDAVCGTVATGVLTISSVPLSDADATGGTVEHASIYDNSAAPGAGTKILEVSCQTGAGSNVIVLSSLSIDAHDTVTLSSLTWTFPASV